MTKGIKEKFNVEIFPDFHQKKIIDSVMFEASNLYESVEKELARQQNSTLGFSSQEEIIDVIFNKELFDFNQLDDIGVVSIAKAAYMNFLEKYSASGGGYVEWVHRRRRKTQEIEISLHDISFSQTSGVVTAPYVGLVRYKNNGKVLTSLFNPEGKTRVFLTRKSSMYCFLIDRTDEERSLMYPSSGKKRSIL
jgi:hypothetical protein